MTHTQEDIIHVHWEAWRTHSKRGHVRRVIRRINRKGSIHFSTPQVEEKFKQHIPCK